MTDKAAKARNEYRRKWAKANRDKIREYNERYWTKRVEREAAEREPAKPAAAV